MKRSTQRLGATLGLLLALAPETYAASSVDLSIRGLITPSACTPSLSSGGVVEFGKMSAKSLNVDSTTPLPDVTLQLHVACAAPTLFALSGKDNRPGTAFRDDGYGYGLGLTPAGEKLGTYLMMLANPVAEGLTLTPLMSMDGGDFWWDFHGPTWLVWHQLAAFGNSDSGAAAPVALQNVTADVEMSTRIAPASGLTLTDEVPLDGSATAELFYL